MGRNAAKPTVVNHSMNIVSSINAGARIVMMMSFGHQIISLVVLLVVMRKADAIRILFGYNMGMTIGLVILQKRARLDGATIPQRKSMLDTICFVRTMMQMLMPSWTY